MTLIKNIQSLKNFGIFNHADLSKLPEFKKFNLIYGWNRGGKTTISRLFSSCEKRQLYHSEKFKQFPQNGEFELKLIDDTIIRSKEIEKSNIQIRVFNQDFIDENLSFEPSKTSNGIVYLSEGDIKNKKKLEILTNKFKEINQNYEVEQKNKESKGKIKNSFLQSVGREVSNTLFDKTYNKINVESRIKEIGLINLNHYIMNEEELFNHEEKVKGKVGKELQHFNSINIKILLFDNLDKIYDHIKLLLSKEIISESIDKLKRDEDLNNWVKKGFEIHKARDEFGTCLFCENPLPPNLFNLFSKHFSKDYLELQSNIELFIHEARSLKFKEISTDQVGLYSELKAEYSKVAGKLNTIIKDFSNWLFIHVEGLLNEKCNNPFDAELVDILEKPIDFENQINQHINLLNKIIDSHNGKVLNHSDLVISSKKKLELHIIAKAIFDGDFEKIEEESQSAIQSVELILKDLSKIKEEIDIAEKESSEISGALLKINSYLKSYFGKNEISLELDDSKKGYYIFRNGEPAINLSEGEKTAIAFSYFIVKVEEKNFKIEDCLVFIDDPISSLDSNFVYHSFSLIREHFEKSKQLFISTHNYQFFNLIKDWFLFKNSQSKEALKKGSLNKPLTSEFFMVESFYDCDKRYSKLKPLDSTLLKFKSEYHFLFAIINRFSKKSPTYEDFYTIGNVSRRFIEIYVDFKIPNSENLRNKMEKLRKHANANGAEISITDLGKLYKLINEFSHMDIPEYVDPSEAECF